MEQAMVRRLGTAIVAVVVTSAFWIFFYNIRNAPQVSFAGQSEVVDPARAPPVEVAEGVTVGPAGLAVPVVGVKPKDLSDTYTQARAGGAWRHDANYIMAPPGRPVVAAAPGSVEKLFFSAGGGNTVYVRSDDGRWMYYYAHLSAYAPGLHEGQRLLRAAPVGYVGATGNANPAGPHLHFAINRMEPGEKWYQGTAINPFPLLAAKPASR
jgi:murein DD-endopeptidase MepM/ murein hydrolase activator NlpD